MTIDDVGGAALYLLSDLASSVTGEILHVDSGYHTVGMVSVNAIQDVARLVTNMATTYTANEESKKDEAWLLSFLLKTKDGTKMILPSFLFTPLLTVLKSTNNTIDISSYPILP